MKYRTNPIKQIVQPQVPRDSGWYGRFFQCDRQTRTPAFKKQDWSKISLKEGSELIFSILNQSMNPSETYNPDEVYDRRVTGFNTST